MLFVLGQCFVQNWGVVWVEEWERGRAWMVWMILRCWSRKVQVKMGV
jgi:hypothetical protein